MADIVTRFHKYEVSGLASFAIEAPATFTAVADKELWDKHFQRKINDNARGISLVRNGQKKIYYDVSETTVVDTGENSTESQIKIIAEVDEPR